MKEKTPASFDVAGRRVGVEAPPFVVAEMSGNHNQSLERALAIVDAAARSGVHGLKIQTYTADTMTLNTDAEGFVIRDEKSLWNGRKLYDLYSEAHTPWEWHDAIFKRCRQQGVIPFSTPFDESAVDFLEELNVPCYKVASFENTDLPLLKKIAATQKPVLVSTGLASFVELQECVQTLRDHGCQHIVLLKCTSTYPASPLNSNIVTIPHMRDSLGCQVGLSDHTPGLGVAVASVALGVTVIEKHFTLSRSDGGVDAAFSLEPAELKDLVIEVERAWQGLGVVHYGVSESEKPSLAFRRSLYVVKDIAEGELMTKENVRALRPGFGLAPRHYEAVVGKACTRAVKKGTPVSWGLIKKD